jgi:sugar phosphate isomerase/epimerase
VSSTAPQTIGATIAFARLDLEAALAELRTAGFDGVEVWAEQLGPGPAGPVVREAHAAAAGELAVAHGLRPVALNAVGDPAFDPHGDRALRERSVQALASQLRLAAALGAPRLLIWEGRIAGAADVPRACAALVDCIRRARDAAALREPPQIAVEPHPFTFALAHDATDALVDALAEAGDAGLLLDYCHVAVALGAEAVPAYAARHRAAIAHVHAADSDGVTSELHVPFGRGAIDLDEVADALGGLDVPVAWDLFGWPAPREIMRTGMAAYRGHCSRIRAAAA